MATPVGNPQNLFLYGYYELTAAKFCETLLGLTLLSLLALSLAALPVLPNAKPLRYLAVFTAACAAGLVLLLGAAYLF